MIIDRLLHQANASAHYIDKDQFYDLKQRILNRYAVRDGFDVQTFPGKVCWGCDGCGTYYYDSGDSVICNRCYGSGWYHPPKLIRLDRWRLGQFVFHSIGSVVHSLRAASEWGTPSERFDGFVRHRHYSRFQQRIAHVALGLFFSRSYLAACFKTWWEWSSVNRFLNRKCIDCDCRLLSFRRKWRCRVCEKIQARLPDEVPF